MSKYYRAGPEIEEICQRILADRQEILKKACNLSRRYGGNRSRVVTKTGIFGTTRVVGFLFKDEPNQKIFKKLKNSEGWAPRLSTKVGKELKKKLDELIWDGLDELMKAIGMDPFKDLNARSPGISKIGNHWYLHVPDDVEPKGCERISDVEYERLAA